MRRAGLAALLLSAAGLSGCEPRLPLPWSPQALPALGENAQRWRDRPLCAAGTQTLWADLQRPTRAAHRQRALLLVQGGGWTRSQRQDLAAMADWLSAAGYTTLRMDYRLVPQVDAAAQAADLRCALRWLQQHAAVLDVAPQAVQLVGHSAGAHLAALLALGSEAPRPAAAVLWAGRYSFDDAAQLRRVSNQLRPGDAQRVALSPVLQAHAGAPPLLLLHAEDDPLAPVQESQRLAQALQAVGAPVQLRLSSEGGHSRLDAEMRAELLAFLAAR